VSSTGALGTLTILTACRAGGGGSKSKHRKTKLREKNLKLAQERSRGAQGAQKEIKETNEAMAEEPISTSHEGSIHPSRRSRVQIK